MIPVTKWLEHHPTDFLLLSKILWHGNMRTTLKSIGPQLDESQGVRRTEEWLEEQRLNKKAKKK